MFDLRRNERPVKIRSDVALGASCGNGITEYAAAGPSEPPGGFISTADLDGPQHREEFARGDFSDGAAADERLGQSKQPAHLLESRGRSPFCLELVDPFVGDDLEGIAARYGAHHGSAFGSSTD